MADSSKIEWTDATWNPVTGCTKVSPGCDNCYAERIVERFKGKGAFEKVTLNEERLGAPLRWRKPRRVFVNSMSDLFHDDVPNSFIRQAFEVMAKTPQHTYQVLTKRHGRMRALLNMRTFQGVFDVWPLPNVWLGVSVEDQKWADIRIPALLDTPAAVRFLSCEPLLGPVDLHAKDSRTFGPQWLPPIACGVNIANARAGDGSSIGDLYKTMYGPNIDWVIVGGESGLRSRPMHPDWARSLRDQCTAAGVPFFLKQTGEWLPAPSNYGPDVPERARAAVSLLFRDDRDVDGQIMLRVGKKRAGRELDGRTWDEYPEVSGG